MAQTVKDFRAFIEITQRKDIQSATIKKNPNGETKFKLRGAHQIYTLTEPDESRAQKIIMSLPPDLQVTNL